MPVLLVSSTTYCFLHTVFFRSFNFAIAILSSGNARPAVPSGLTPVIIHSACLDVGQNQSILKGLEQIKEIIEK